MRWVQLRVQSVPLPMFQKKMKPNPSNENFASFKATAELEIQLLQKKINYDHLFTPFKMKGFAKAEPKEEKTELKQRKPVKKSLLKRIVSNVMKQDSFDNFKLVGQSQ